MFLSHHQVDKLVFDTSRLSKLVQVFFLLIQVVLGFIGVVLVAFGRFKLFRLFCVWVQIAQVVPRRLILLF